MQEETTVRLASGWRSIARPETNARRQFAAILVGTVDRGERELLEVVRATHPRRGFTDFLNSRKQQAN